MTSKLNLYEQLADELGGLIATRVFGAGERLPSIRTLSQQRKLSISTVMQAMRLMEDRGLVDARPQAGFYVRQRPRTLPAEQHAPLREAGYVGINNLLMRILQANETPGVVQLGSAWPPDEILPIRRMQQLVGALAKRDPTLLARVSCYGTNEPEFIRQIQRRALDWGRLDADEVVVTSSCTEAINLCLRAVAKPGDTIAIESSTYFVLLQLIESLGMKALEIPTDPKTGLSVDALELALDAKLVQACLFIPNVNNPLGCIMPPAHKRRLADLLAKHGVPLIEDDVYGDLCFGGERPPPVKAFDTSGNVLLCSSFSKAVSPATRVGYVVAGRHAQQIAFLKTVSSGATSHFFQAVLADFIGSSGYDKQIRKIRRALAQRVAQMSDAVTTYFPAECSLAEPQGGFVLWVQLPPHANALALHGEAIRQGIAFMPGPLFSASGKFSNCLRLNCGNAWNAKIEDAVQRLGRLVHEHCALR